jgi:hypothetical protein
MYRRYVSPISPAPLKAHTLYKTGDTYEAYMSPSRAPNLPRPPRMGLRGIR